MLALPDGRTLRRRILILALPIIGENLLQTGFGFVDMAFVGHLGSLQLAGTGLANQVIFILMAVLMSLNIGTTVLVSQELGAGSLRRAQGVVYQTMYLGLVLSVVTLLSGVFLSYRVFTLFPNSAGIVGYAGDYLLWILAPGIVLIFNYILGASLRGAGDTRSPLISAIVTNLLNIVLDYLLIFGKFGFPQWGVAGAAIATTLSRAVGVSILLFIIFRRRKGHFSLERHIPGINWETMKRILRIGVPSSLERLSFTVGGLFFAGIILSLGPQAFAAHRVALTVESLSYNPGFGFAAAATTVVGFLVGKGEFPRARRAAFETWKMAALAMSVLGLVFFVGRTVIVRIFSTDPVVLALSSSALFIIAFAQPLLATVFAMEGALRGGGNTTIPMLATAAGMWLIRIPLAFVFVTQLHWGIAGAWLAMTADIAFKAGVLAFMFVRRSTFKSHVLPDGSAVAVEGDQLATEVLSI